jgi:hypothetical protein
MAGALIQHTVGKIEYRVYIFLFVLSWAFMSSTFFTGWNPGTVYEPAFLMPFEMGMFWGVALLSFPLAYWVNKKGDNQDFWRRYICLDISLSIFLALFAIPLMIIGAALDIFIPGIYGYADVALEVVFNIAWLGLLWVYFKRVSTASAGQNVSGPV